MTGRSASLYCAPFRDDPGLRPGSQLDPESEKFLAGVDSVVECRIMRGSPGKLRGAL